jgi:hypothetical protein
MKWIRHLVFIILLCLPTVVFAEIWTSYKSVPADRGRRIQPRQIQQRVPDHRWESLSPRERNSLRKWRHLSEDQKAVILNNYRRWRRLPPERKRRLRERWDYWRRLSPEWQERLKRRYREERDHSPE